MVVERTLILIKPDGVARNLIGKIITRFEDAGLKTCAMKMVWASDDKAKEHYILDEEWAKGSYANTKESYEKAGKELKYKDHMEFGEAIQGALRKFLQEGPAVAIVFEGPHAIELGRKMVGATEPRKAAPGSIRGDFASVESYQLADKNERAVRNLIHASDTLENAQREISVWFEENEIHDYKKDLDKHF